MVWIISKCPHCKTIYNSANATLQIGSPLLVCRKCGNEFVDESIMEWDLKTDREKSAYRFMLVYSSFIYSFGLIMLVAAGIFITEFDYSNWAGSLSLVAPVAFYLVGVFFFHKLFQRRFLADIRDSRSRLQNEGYKSQLDSAGLLDRVLQFNEKKSTKEAHKQKQKELWQKNT